jgi:nitrate reductase cytochrome c-type subunit
MSIVQYHIYENFKKCLDIKNVSVAFMFNAKLMNITRIMDENAQAIYYE